MKLKFLFFIIALFQTSFLLAQGTVIGTITSQEDGMPLPGTSVIVVGTDNGVTTDFDGNYKIDNVPSDATLRFSYIGFLTTDIAVNGQSTISLALQANAQQLDEAVITGYTSERKVDLTSRNH